MLGWNKEAPEMTELHPQRITIRGKAAHTFDRLPAKGAKAPGFFLPDSGYRDWSLEDFAGRSAILNVVPTLESEASRDSARKLVEALAGRRGAVALTISADLPAALARWSSELEGPNGKMLSTFRSPEFGMAYGTLIVEHEWMGLQARAVIALDGEGTVMHRQLMGEATEEPDYAAALEALGLERARKP